MSDLLIGGSKNDLVLTNGDLTFCRGSSAIAQDVLQQLQMFLGEWFLDTSKGIPWLQSILVKSPNLNVINATLQNAICNVNGVSQLVAFNYTYNNATRELSITFQAKCVNGQVISLNTAVGV